MSGDDSELERLKAKRLAEMQKNISSREPPSPDTSDNKPSTRDVVVSRLGYRGLEVLENAEFQFPSETKLVLEKLSKLVESGELDEKLDGGRLLYLFRLVGLNIKMNIKINVEQDGKFVSLSDKLRSDSGSGD